MNIWRFGSLRAIVDFVCWILLYSVRFHFQFRFLAYCRQSLSLSSITYMSPSNVVMSRPYSAILLCPSPWNGLEHQLPITYLHTSESTATSTTDLKLANTRQPLGSIRNCVPATRVRETPQPVPPAHRCRTSRFREASDHPGIWDRVLSDIHLQLYASKLDQSKHGSDPGLRARRRYV